MIPSCKERGKVGSNIGKEDTRSQKIISKNETNPDGFGSRLKKELDLVDSSKGRWSTETFGEVASIRLKSLGKAMMKNGSAEYLHLQSFFDSEPQFDVLRPSGNKLDVIYKGDQIKVFRANVSQVDDKKSDFRKVLKDLAAPLLSLGEPHSKFKIFRVNEEGEFVLTKVIVLFYAHDDNGNSLQINARWNVVWTKAEVPLIRKIELIDYEEIHSVSEDEQFFVDSTRAIIPENTDAQEQLSKGLLHWSRGLEPNTGVSTNGYNGLSVGDLNGDGLDDLFVCQTGGIPNRVFLQTANGRLKDHSELSGANWLNDTRCVLIVDLDNDGDNDLVLNVPNGIVFMENDGAAQFTKRQEFLAKGAPFGLAAADPDGDGFLDVYVCGYGSVWGGVGEYKHHIPHPMHDADNGGANLFLRNSGKWTFVDETQSVGFNHNNTRWSLSAAWEDYDNDGDLDLYVANDFGRNNLYQNEFQQTGILRFSDVAPELGVEDLSPSMSASWGDPNNDGIPDLYVSNMFSSAGNRITTQSQFMTEASQKTRDHFLRMSRGNTLLQGRKSQDQIAFQDTSEESGITVGRWAWASRMMDINNDGWQDILIANGFMTGEDPADL